MEALSSFVPFLPIQEAGTNATRKGSEHSFVGMPNDFIALKLILFGKDRKIVFVGMPNGFIALKLIIFGKDRNIVFFGMPNDFYSTKTNYFQKRL